MFLRGVNKELLIFVIKQITRRLLITNHICIFSEEIKAVSGSTNDDPKEVIFLLGGFQGKIEGSVKKLVLPTDICELFQNDPHQCKTTLGCAYCSHFDEKTSSTSNKNSTFCYSNTKMKPAACSSEFQSGTVGK